jgi:hypothetical protein
MLGLMAVSDRLADALTANDVRAVRKLLDGGLHPVLQMKMDNLGRSGSLHLRVPRSRRSSSKGALELTS